ncbi:MAG: hypothetical protein HY791_24385 [Deltaproteobacteria bacterium]|nr:hypothetical protein [Deltaproteobacteria bacterium]
MKLIVCLLPIVMTLEGRALALPQPPHDELGNGVTCSDCHTRYLEETDATHSDTGVASSATVRSVSDSSKSWATDQWKGGSVSFPTLGLWAEITANSATTLTWERDLRLVPISGTGFQVYKATDYDIETKCRSCHNPSGSASALAEVALHVVRGDTVVGCGKCHEPHNVEPSSGTGPQRRLVRSTPRWQGAGPVTHPSGGPSRFITGAPGYDGICETCHTETAHHRNDATGDHTHYADQDCTASCHTHATGFVPSCISCHASAQGSRRAVVGEFPASDAHAHYGTSLSPGSCTVCHDQGTHGDGIVDLIDPDNASNIISGSGWATLASSPAASSFCLGCHDANGAQRLGAKAMDPFGNGNAPPDESSRFAGTLQWNEWYGDGCFGNEGTLRAVNSHHDVSAADQAFSGAKLGCLNCHGSHASSGTRKLVDPFVPAAWWFGSTTDFCISCHTGGSGPTPDFGFPPGVTGPTIPLRALASCGYNSIPWYVEVTWQNSAHGPSSKRGWPGYSGAPTANMDCTTCHDAHGSYTPTNPLGNPYMIRDGVDGTALVDDGARTAGWLGPPWATYGLSQSVVVGISGLSVGWGGANGLCSACHSRWQQAYDWHDFCTGCQTCHGHGQAWGEWDFVSGSNLQLCP